MIEFKTGNFDWHKELINPETDKPRIALVFCHSSEQLNEWFDLLPENQVAFKNFGYMLSSREVESCFKQVVENAISLLSDLPYPIIMTTHRLELMSCDVSRPDCIFVLQRDSMVAKPIWTLTDKELRFAHNLQRMWRGGMFD